MKGVITTILLGAIILTGFALCFMAVMIGKANRRG